MDTGDDFLPPPASTGDAQRRDAGLRRARRVRARRAAVRRRRAVAGLTLAAALALTLLWVTAPSPAAHPGAPHRPARAVARSILAPKAAPSPGSLPQTHTYPSGTSTQFKTLMASLWSGVARDSPSAALPAFFPLGAYLQLKSITGASSDWTNRLVHDYGLDIAAAHTLLGPHASRARLLAVEVPASYGHWIAPGVCDNRLGYYEMPNARVVYREDGQTHSFGIASMISWRGVWYVVHLGAILRSSDTGMVDDAALGPGISAYSSTC